MWRRQRESSPVTFPIREINIWAKVLSLPRAPNGWPGRSRWGNSIHADRMRPGGGDEGRRGARKEGRNGEGEREGRDSCVQKWKMMEVRGRGSMGARRSRRALLTFRVQSLEVGRREEQGRDGGRERGRRKVRGPAVETGGAGSEGGTKGFKTQGAFKEKSASK